MARFRGTTVKRTGRDRFLRNVLIACLGNSGDETLLPLIEERLYAFTAGARHGGRALLHRFLPS